jgi:hypothetical protein
VLLVGLLLNALIGRWWADPMAGLVMVPIIAKEGVDGLIFNFQSDGAACVETIGSLLKPEAFAHYKIIYIKI